MINCEMFCPVLLSTMEVTEAQLLNLCGLSGTLAAEFVLFVLKRRNRDILYGQTIVPIGREYME